MGSHHGFKKWTLCYFQYNGHNSQYIKKISETNGSMMVHNGHYFEYNDYNGHYFENNSQNIDWQWIFFNFLSSIIYRASENYARASQASFSPKTQVICKIMVD